MGILRRCGGFRQRMRCAVTGARVAPLALGVFFIAYPGLTAWAKLWRASPTRSGQAGGSEWSEAGEEADEARRGHGCPVPLQRQDAAFGLGALKRRPYNYGKARKPMRLGVGTGVPCPYNGGARLRSPLRKAGATLTKFNDNQVQRQPSSTTTKFNDQCVGRAHHAARLRGRLVS